MRQLKYLSPSSLNTYETDPYEFFYRYLADDRPERPEQLFVMSVGSAFDAYVKHNLYLDLYGTLNEQFEFTTLFESQVEPQNRDQALEAGQYLYDCYRKVGAYNELLTDMEQGSDARFEFTTEFEVDGVNLLGKPDCLYTRHDGTKVLLDWKCNGYCSKSTVSPAKNYKKVVDAWDETEAKPSRNNGEAHKNYQPVLIGDYEIGRLPFEDGGKQWADQVFIYLLTLGEPVGTGAIVAVDQLACKPGKTKPLVRVAQHRGQLSSEFQTNTFERIKTAWTNIQAGYIFTDRSKEENDQELELLNKASTLISANNIFDSVMMRF